MKKLFVVMALVATMGLLVSCERTCNCKTVIVQTDTDPDFAMSDTSHAEQSVSTKGKCSELNSTAVQNIYTMTQTTTVTCE